MKTAELGLRVRPDFYLIHNAAGRACALLDRGDQAVAHFDREQELAPGHVMTWISDLWRAVAHVRSGRWEQGEDAYNACIASHPDQLGPFIGKAVVARQLGRTEDSRIAWQQVQRLDGASVGYHVISFRRAYGGNPHGDTFLHKLSELIAASTTR